MTLVQYNFQYSYDTPGAANCRMTLRKSHHAESRLTLVHFGECFSTLSLVAKSRMTLIRTPPLVRSPCAAGVLSSRPERRVLYNSFHRFPIIFGEVLYDTLHIGGVLSDTSDMYSDVFFYNTL